ncbi:Protein asteroid 1 [Entomophthora muscae]|uniref:Protein asteroid 1 n=1 Tax=Entomophthora muscae TaxID=34485 RepID=A0ACC2RKL1_9FUNG|nr:Protein asteroid 1 [Entomophthora muscae]
MLLPKLEKLEYGQSRGDTRDSQAKFLPILAHSLFLDTLKEMNQSIIMAHDEADQPSAFYAKRFDAAIISNDSDFIIYTIPRGFLFMPSFSASRSTIEALANYTHYLTAKASIDHTKPQFEIGLYFNPKVCEHLKINPIHFPLLASLIGNDITGESYNEIMKQVSFKLQGFPYRRGLSSRNLVNNHKLVEFFKTLKDKDSAQALSNVQQKLGFPPSIMDRVYSSCLSYQINELYFQDTLNNPHVDELMAGKLFTLYKNGILGFQAMDIVIHSRFWGLPLIEDVGAASSSWVVSAPLRTLFWALIGLPDSNKSFQDIIPMSNLECRESSLSRADLELTKEKRAPFQALFQVIHRSSEEARVNYRGRFWLLLAFLQANPPGMPSLELADYVPLYSCSIHHVALVLMLRYLGEQLSPIGLSSSVLKGFVATYVFLCNRTDNTPLEVYAGLSVTIKPSAMKVSNQLQTLILSLQMLWGLVVNGGHEMGPSYKLINWIDSHLFFHFSDMFSNGLSPDAILNQADCVLFNQILPFVYRQSEY